MKIGLALSGCDAGGVSAYHVISRLEEKGFDIQMVSACCTPAITALLHGAEDGRDRAERAAAAYVETTGRDTVDSALAAAADRIPSRLLAANKTVAVNTVNVPDGRVVTFTNAFSLEAEKLRTLPLEDTYDVLSSTVSPLDGMGSYRLGGYRLCDYSVWYGCPLYPLRLNGISKVLSISFLPRDPQTPYAVMVKGICESSARPADLHIAVEFPPERLSAEELIEFATEKTESCIDDITWRMLYPVSRQKHH